jgi:hypothetical protein
MRPHGIATTVVIICHLFIVEVDDWFMRLMFPCRGHGGRFEDVTSVCTGTRAPGERESQGCGIRYTGIENVHDAQRNVPNGREQHGGGRFDLDEVFGSGVRSTPGRVNPRYADGWLEQCTQALLNERLDERETGSERVFGSCLERDRCGGFPLEAAASLSRPVPVTHT